MAEERESIIKIVVDNESASKKLAENTQQLEANRAKLRELNAQLTQNRKAFEAGSVGADEYQRSANETAKAINELTAQNKALGTESRQLASQLAAPVGSLNEQRANLAQLLRAYDNFVIGINGTEEDFKALEAEIQSVTKAVKGQEEATGRGGRSVGLYEEAIKNALTSNNALAGSVGNLTSVIDSVKSAVAGYQAVLADSTSAISSFTTSLREADLSARGLAVSFTRLSKTTLTLNNALKVLRVGLLALPLFAIIAALTSLVAFFSSTQRGADLLSKAITPLRVIFDKLLGVLQNAGQFIFDNFTKTFLQATETVKDFGKTIGEGLTKVFQDPVQAVKDLGQAIIDNVIKRFEALKLIAPAITKIFSGNVKDGFKDLANATIQLGTGIEGGADKIVDFSKNVVKQTKEAAKAVVNFVKDAVKEGSKIADLNIAIEKAEIAIIKRRAEANKVIKEQQLLADDVTKSEQERIDATFKAEQAIESLRKEELALFDLRGQLLDLEQSLNDTDRNGEKAAAELAAARADAEAGLTDRLREQITKRASLQTELNGTLGQLNLQQLKDQEQSLQQQLSNERLSFEERVQLTNDLARKRVEIERKALADIEDDNTISDLKKEAKAREVQRAIVEIEAQAAAELAALGQQRIQQQLDTNAALLEIEAQRIAQQFANEEAAGVATVASVTALTDAKLTALFARYEAEQEAAKGNADALAIIEADLGNKITAIQSEEALKRKAIKEAELQQQKDSVNATASIVNALGGLFGRQTAAAKVAAKASATLAYIQELQNIPASASSPLFPGNPPTAGLAGAGIAAGLKIAATIRYIGNLASISQAGGGGQFMTNGETLLRVGDNPGGRELVTVQPISGMGQTKIIAGSGLTDISANRQSAFAATQSVRQQSAQVMQQPVLVLEELTRLQKRVLVAEKISRS